LGEVSREVVGKMSHLSSSIGSILDFRFANFIIKAAITKKPKPIAMATLVMALLLGSWRLI